MHELSRPIGRMSAGERNAPEADLPCRLGGVMCRRCCRREKKCECEGPHRPSPMTTGIGAVCILKSAGIFDIGDKCIGRRFRGRCVARCTALNNVLRSSSNADWELLVLDELVLSPVMPLDCEVELSSMLCTVVAALWASVMSPDSADCSKLASVLATEFDCPPWLRNLADNAVAHVAPGKCGRGQRPTDQCHQNKEGSHKWVLHFPDGNSNHTSA